MTAQQEVVPVFATARPALIPFGRSKGRPVERIEELVSPGGETIAFRCKECLKTYPKFESVFGHLQKHTRRAPKMSEKETVASVKSVLNEIDRLTRENERLKRKFSEERSARRAAERRIEQIERLFAPKS